MRMKTLKSSRNWLKAKKERNGLAVGCSATLLNAAIFLKQSCENLSASTILGWHHSKCLSYLVHSRPNEVRPTIFA